MAKKSAIFRDINRRKKIEKFKTKRETLKKRANDTSLMLEERFEAHLALAKLPRNSSPCRARNRCQISGRPRGYTRKLKLSRIALRELGAAGYIPGMVKSSW